MSRPRVRLVATDRRGGASRPPYDSFNLGDHVGDDPAAVAANRARLAAGLGLDPSAMTWMNQVHSAEVAVVDAPADGPIPGVDGLVTAEPGLALCVLTADCVPVLLSDEPAGVIAAVHAGRVGAAAGIVPAALEVMRSLGARPDRVHALLGAAASGARYEVPGEMAADVESRLPGSRTVTSAGTPGLDLRAGILRQLHGLGVRAVDSVPACTISSPRHFSHRREGVTGRQACVALLDPRPDPRGVSGARRAARR